MLRVLTGSAWSLAGGKNCLQMLTDLVYLIGFEGFLLCFTDMNLGVIVFFCLLCFVFLFRFSLFYISRNSVLKGIHYST